ncbi:MAG: NAD(P)H-hydrate dehydratase [Bacteroidia bacterium]
MINLLTSTQIREAEQFTIDNQLIASIDLMERAAEAFLIDFRKYYPDQDLIISVLCGQGNNGGDGLAIARLLHLDGYKFISVCLVNFQAKESEDYSKNLTRLAQTKVPILTITAPEQFKNGDATLIIDAILGSGLNKPINGAYADLVQKVNSSGKIIVSVDVPTGLPSEGVIDQAYRGIKADLVICFQLPKLNFFFPESAKAMNEFKVASIGLDEDFMANQSTFWKLITKPMIKPRARFTHKGTYGHALIVAGDEDAMGAALLSARACLRIGAGLTTLCLPENGRYAINTSLPEVMTLRKDDRIAEDVLKKITAIAIGPGIGTRTSSEALLEQLIHVKMPMVIDADAINILSGRKDLLDRLLKGSIITPHMKEFDRLFGDHQTWWERLETAKGEALKRRIIIILKNQYTFVCLPNGEVHINQTGNPGMASGGMGDVLTGMIVGLLAQSYSSADASTLAVYLHGKAGDELSETLFTISASQVADQLPRTVKRIVKSRP